MSVCKYIFLLNALLNHSSESLTKDERFYAFFMGLVEYNTPRVSQINILMCCGTYCIVDLLTIRIMAFKERLIVIQLCNVKLLYCTQSGIGQIVCVQN